MQFNIEILSVNKSQQPSKKGSMLDVLEVAFKKDGKVEGKKLFSFASKEVYTTLSEAHNGEVYTITAEKEGDYWQWKQANIAGQVVAGSPQQATSSATKSPVKGEWETREERAARQILIVKQSSLSAAVATLKTDKTSPSSKDVLELADVYASWVFGQSQPKAADDWHSLPDDIPM